MAQLAPRTLHNNSAAQRGPQYRLRRDRGCRLVPNIYWSHTNSWILNDFLRAAGWERGLNHFIIVSKTKAHALEHRSGDVLIGISAVKLIDGEQIIVEIYGRAKRREEKWKKRSSHSFMYQVKTDTCTCDWLAQHGYKKNKFESRISWTSRVNNLRISFFFFFLDTRRKTAKNLSSYWC